MRLMLSPVLGLILLSGIANAESVQSAAPIDRSAPDYPETAGDTEGYVKLHFDISSTGHVENATVVESNPKSVFDQAAINAVSHWTYRPRTVDGHAVDQPDNAILLRFKPAPHPKLVYAPPPSYPETAYVAKAEGAVKVAFDVTETGATENAHVVESNPPGLFDEEAIKDVQKWKFTPLIIDGKIRATPNMETTIPFKLPTARVSAKPVHRTPPRYPISAESQGIIGSCEIDFVIEPDGTVGDPEIEMCFPAGYFEQVTLDAIKTWTFEPGHGPSGNIAMPGRIMISYRLNGLRERDIHYLKDGEWIKLKYTLTSDGRAKEVQIVDKSSPDLPTLKAIEQIQRTRFAPIVENGVAVEKPEQEVTILGK